MLPKAHLTSHPKMSGSKWVTTPSWLPGSLRPFLYSSSMYSCHLLLNSSASVRSLSFLSFIVPIFALNDPLVSPVFLKRSQFSSFSHVWPFATPWTAHARPPCPSPTPGVYPNSCPLSQWCHSAISSTVISISSCLQSFPASGSFQMSQIFTSGGQSIGVSASTSVLPTNIQDWFPLGWTSGISLESKGLSRVSSNTTVQKHKFFGVQLSFYSYFHIHTWLLEKP